MTQSLGNKNNFKYLVRKKTTKWPTQNGFGGNEWLRVWESSSNNTHKDKMLYDAGIIFDRVLSELRNEISALYKTSPDITTSQRIRAYCGMANRDRAILNSSSIEKGADLSSLTYNSNKLTNELSFQEIAVGCVDSIACAIRSNLRETKTAASDNNPMDSFSFIRKELCISQLYDFYESYWLALVWGSYDFIKIDSTDDAYEIRQVASELVIAYESSQRRKQKLAVHRMQSIIDCTMLDWLKTMGCVDTQRIGKKRKLVSKTIGQLDHKYQIANATFLAEFTSSQDQLPPRFFDSEFKSCGFTLSEVMAIFRILIILAQISLDRLPQDEGVFSFKKAIEFCPKVNRAELVREIAKASGFYFDKCSKIIDFLTFKGGYDEDLWSHPIIRLDNNEVTFLVAALCEPEIQRCIEHWLTKLNIDMVDKGLSYEKVVLDCINKELKRNPLFVDHELAISRRIKLTDNCEEEIDLIFRFGRVIIVGEVKSIVTTDSAISLHRTHEIILKAAEQAKRKKKFMVENMASVFRMLKWTHNKELDYEVLPLILTSSSICVGLVIDEIPVCDLAILSKYFRDKIVPLVSVSEKEHVAWFELYNNFAEAQANIEKYLRKPPQLTLTRDDFRYEANYMPFVSDNSPKIRLMRLLKTPTDIDDCIKRDYSFPVCKSLNFKEKTYDYDAIM